MLKENNRNLELRHAIKRACGLEELLIHTQSRSIKRPKKEEIYHSTDYANFCSFCHQIKIGPEDWTPNERYKEAKRLLATKEVDS